MEEQAKATLFTPEMETELVSSCGACAHQTESTAPGSEEEAAVPGTEESCADDPDYSVSLMGNTHDSNTHIRFMGMTSDIFFYIERNLMVNHLLETRHPEMQVKI